MNRKARAIAAVGSMVPLFFGVGIPTAQAHEGGPNDSCIGWEAPYGASCFEYSGDDQWVYDGNSNGLRVGVLIETDYGKTRICENSHGAGTWHECTFDHREDSCVRWTIYQRNGGEEDARDEITGPWLNVSTGNPC